MALAETLFVIYDPGCCQPFSGMNETDLNLCFAPIIVHLYVYAVLGYVMIYDAISLKFTVVVNKYVLGHPNAKLAVIRTENQNR